MKNKRKELDLNSPLAWLLGQLAVVNLVSTNVELPNARKIFAQKVKQSREKATLLSKKLESSIESEIKKLRKSRPDLTITESDPPTFDFELPEDNMLLDVEGPYSSHNRDAAWEEIYLKIKENTSSIDFRNLFEFLLKFIWEDDGHSLRFAFYLSPSLLIFKYANYYDLREKIINIAEYNWRVQVDKSSFDSFPFPTSLKINDKGAIVPAEEDNLLNMLKTLDARRIRICPACSNLFWAYQGNQKCCSKKCFNHYAYLEKQRKELYCLETKLKKQQNSPSASSLIQETIELIEGQHRKIEKLEITTKKLKEENNVSI